MPLYPALPTASTTVTGGVLLPVPIASGGTGQASASAALTALGGLVLQASTGASGYALVNNTGTIITWTPANDGVVHWACVFGTMQVGTSETGGQITLVFKDPGGNSSTTTLWAAGLGTGLQTPTAKLVPVQAGQAVSVTQNTALTGGASTLWAGIWGF